MRTEIKDTKLAEVAEAGEIAVKEVEEFIRRWDSYATRHIYLYHRWRLVGVWVPTAMLVAFGLFCLLHLCWPVTTIASMAAAGVYFIALAEFPKP